MFCLDFGLEANAVKKHASYGYSSLLSKLDKCVQLRPDHWASARDMYYCAYSMKTAKNFQNVLPATDFSSFSKVKINIQNISISE